MKLHAWRIVKAKYAASAFSGDGARKYGGRWNRPGHAVVYVAGSVSLAMLELLVHLQSRRLLTHYVLFPVTFDANLVTTVEGRALPANWRQSPPPMAVQSVGDRWLAAGTSAVLRVPSGVVPDEWNYLLNPAHADFPKIAIGPRQAAEFDPRLFKA